MLPFLNNSHVTMQISPQPSLKGHADELCSHIGRAWKYKSIACDQLEDCNGLWSKCFPGAFPTGTTTDGGGFYSPLLSHTRLQGGLGHFF